MKKPKKIPSHVYATYSGNLYIKPFELFSDPKVQKLIADMAKLKLTH